ncbi:MAG: glycosyltransferase [Acidobacteriales bacterium]|nr:glycosyltransferase [Terriglobales bacterium]
MKIGLVTAFPPSGRQLNEYGLHLARELVKESVVSLTIIGDELDVLDFATDAHGKPIDPESLKELPEYNVVRTWKFGAVDNPLRILRAVRKLDPDVVWFNLVFSTFATQKNPIAAFIGLCTPALIRLAGYETHITLHHLMENVDFEAAGISNLKEKLFRFASFFATKMLLLANSLTVLLPGYRRTLLDRYKASNIHLRAHGILGPSPVPPDFSKRGNPDQRILAIGHWGTYKRLETLLEAFTEVQTRVPEARLLIGGANHHTTPRYWEDLAEKYKDNDRINFLGYVAEDDIPELFATSSILVMPYDSATGSSGPAHQACQYGVPIVCADIHDFREMAENEEMMIEFYPRGDAKALEEKLVDVLRSPEKQQLMAERNFSAALRQTMPAVIQNYLRYFARKRKREMVLQMNKLRRSSVARTAALRRAGRAWAAWM